MFANSCHHNLESLGKRRVMELILTHISEGEFFFCRLSAVCQCVCVYFIKMYNILRHKLLLFKHGYYFLFVQV